jgi:hypothetical protein
LNATALKDYLAAASANEPSASFMGPRKLLAAAAAATPSGEWEIGISAGDASVLRLALRSPDGLAAIWNSKASRWLRVELARRDRLGKTLRSFSPKLRSARTLPAVDFSASIFEEPVASALAAFDALAPIGRIQIAPGRRSWTLNLAAPPAWPLFLRCDIASAFAPRAAQLSLLLRDARVVALDFDGDALWARLA